MARKAELWAHSVAGWSYRLTYPSACYFSSRKPPVSSGFCGGHGVTRQECERRARWTQLGYQAACCGSSALQGIWAGWGRLRSGTWSWATSALSASPWPGGWCREVWPRAPGLLEGRDLTGDGTHIVPFLGSAPHPAGLAASSQLRKSHGHAALHLADRQGHGLSSGWTKYN